MALLSAAGPGGMKFKTGVMVLYADDVSFTLMTPEGHMFAGWITFSAFEDGDATVAQAQVLMRAQDPLGELGLDVRRPRQGEHVLGADAREPRRVSSAPRARRSRRRSSASTASASGRARRTSATRSRSARRCT